MAITEKQYIVHCCRLIESTLRWAPSDTWMRRDFENLSQLVFDKTKILLSASTLKRLWSDSYKGTPHPGTLNALAMFLEFENWVAFKKDQCMIVNESFLEKGSAARRPFPLSGILKWGSVFLAAGSLLAGCFFLLQKKETVDYAEADILFEVRKSVETGVPNSIIYDYDVSAIASDSIFVYPCSPRQKRIRLDKRYHNRTCVLYHPGYYKARLWVDKTVIREQPLHITTDGWQALVQYDMWGETVLYIPKAEYPRSSLLYLPPQILKKHQVDTDKNMYFVSYYRVQDFGNIDGDNFTVEARMKNARQEGGLLGQHADIVIICENGRMFVPMVASGMVGNLFFQFIDVKIDAHGHDLSPFGCDASQWHVLKCEVKNRQVILSRDEEEIYQLKFNKPAGQIKGICFLFNGSGSVDWVRLQNALGNAVFNDDFDA